MASNKYIHIAKKLQSACKKSFGVKLLIDQRQWYHKEKDIPITVYTLYEVVFDDERNKSSKTQLFQTYSQIQIVLYLRDFWYHLNGWEIPTDNIVWEELKKKYAEKEEPSDISPNTKRFGTKWTSQCNRTAIYHELYESRECDRGSSNDSGLAEKK